MESPLRIRWLGRVTYSDAWAVQRGLFSNGADSHLLLLEHPHIYTLGASADAANLLDVPDGVPVEKVDRGGDVTYHGPGQLVGYPILNVAGKRGGGVADTVAYVRSVEDLLIEVLASLGVSAGSIREYPGVWVDHESEAPRKIAAIGVKLSRGRSMHGFALNVDPDMSYFDHIVPCGIADRAVTSLALEGVEVKMREVVDLVAKHAADRWGVAGVERADVVWQERSTDLSAFSRGAGPGEPVRLTRRLSEAGVSGGLDVAERKPEWMRVKLEIGPEYRRIRRTMADLDLVTVCEEAGCPNIYECWNDGTATFMINGERCTRACGFCLVDTRKPEAVDSDEPARVAEAVEKMGLLYAVVTAVARDDLLDGGASQFSAVIAAIRDRTPATQVEVLIPDCKGDAGSLQQIFDARPDVLNHNIETVARLQRAVRPSASYARSLGVLARAKAAGLVTKSSIVVGMGESFQEVLVTMADLAGVGCDIVTVGQYLRPTTNHLPIDRWWSPAEFDELAAIGRDLGMTHIESSPLTRSSHHARQAAASAT